MSAPEPEARQPAWEVPVAVACLVILVLALGVQAGRALANLVAGAGWTVPSRDDLIASVPAVLGGDAAAGLDRSPPSVAGPVAVRLWVTVVEVLVTAAAAWVAVRLGRWWGGRPGTGAAVGPSRSQPGLLSQNQLRRNASGTRPDLTGRRLAPTELGWRLGRARQPRGGELWVPWDRTLGVLGPPGSGKSVDVVLPAVLAAPGPVLVTSTKVDDLLLVAAGRRPVYLVDPVAAVHGTEPDCAAVQPLVWDPLAGCVDPMVAERRARAFAAGTQLGAVAAGLTGDEARFAAAEAAVVLQAFLHAAALTGRGLDEVLSWAADPLAATTPAQVLGGHPHAAPLWHALLHGALHGPQRSVSATVATLQQALSVLFHEPVRRRLLPGPNRPATDLAEVIARGGTICLLARDDPYASASPVLTAVAEDVLDAATAAAKASPWGRLCPPMLACLDDVPTTAAMSTLRARMVGAGECGAAGQGAGVAVVWTAQSVEQLSSAFGEVEARALVGLTSAVAVLGETPDRHATVRAGGGRPVVVRLSRCLDGAAGRLLLAERDRARERLRESMEQGRRRRVSPAARGTAAVVAAHRHGLTGAPDPAEPAPEAVAVRPRLLLIDGGMDEED